MIQLTLPLSMSRPRFHAANYTGSPRLQAVMKVLADGQWKTGLQIAQGAGVLNPAGCVSELNAPINGLDIETAYQGENGNGRKVWKYRWLKREGGA